MREIEFRGKSTKDEAWVYGSYESFMQVLTDREIATIHVKMDWGLNSHVEVWDDTVGQYTGIKDKNGKKIFEGDIVAEHNGDITGQIIQHASGEWQIAWFGIFGGVSKLYSHRDLCEVIGSVHDDIDYMEDDQISLCKNCWCMTHTINNKCGKCGANKEK
nr:MAG TPA: YopX protein [Caudoviricetes sp.]